MVLAVGIACGRAEGGGAVIGGLCEGTLCLDGVVDRYRDCNGYAGWGYVCARCRG